MVRELVPARGRRRWRGRASAALIGLLVVSLLTLGGCGKRKILFTGQDDTATTPSTTADLHSLLPSTIQVSKTIRVGSEIAYPPMESFDAGQNPVGVDVDIANALGAKLGVQFAFQNTKFEDLVSGLVARKYDVVMSGMKDTSARRDMGVDFVDYFQAGYVIIVQKGNPKKISSYSDLCGRAVAVQKGTPQEDLATSLASECVTRPTTTTTRKGQVVTTVKPTTTSTVKLQPGQTTTSVKGGTSAPRLSIQSLADDAAVLAAIKGARVVAGINELPAAANAVLQQPNAFDLVGEQLQLTPYGIAVPNDDVQLRAALVAAMKAIIADGTYATILQKWRVPQGAVSDVNINSG